MCNRILANTELYKIISLSKVSDFSLKFFKIIDEVSFFKIIPKETWVYMQVKQQFQLSMPYQKYMNL